MSSFFTPGNYQNTTTLGQTMRVRQDVARLRGQAMTAQTQLASGYKSATHGGLKADATVAQELRHRMTRLEGYEKSISTINMRLFTVQQGMNTLRDGTDKLAQAAADAYAPGFPDSLNTSRITAQSVLGTNVSLLNMSQGNRYLFAGADVATKPVADATAMVEGQGGRLGLRDTMALRLTADMGGGSGRLATGVVGNDVTVTHDGGAFGMRLTNITGPGAIAPTQINTTTVEGTVDATAAAAGERVVLSFAMPDGTDASVTLIASNAVPLPDSPSKDTYYFTQGNVGSFDTVLTNGINTIVNRDMTGASAVAAANDFFDHDQPRIPDGNAATATGLAISGGTVVDWFVAETQPAVVKGPTNDPTALTPTAGDTYLVSNAGAVDVWTGQEGKLATFNGTSWTFTQPEHGSRVVADAPTAGQPAHVYSYDSGAGTWSSDGEAPPHLSARDSVRAKVDDALSMSHGVRADEAGIRDNVKLAAMLLSADLDTDAPAPYQQVAKKVSHLQGDTKASAISIQAELGVVEERVRDLAESHKDFRSILNNQILDVEGIDQFELATRLQDIMARLESSYQVIARMQNMSLSNYL